MGILFIVALLFAWPTFGISIVLWFAILVFKGQGKANRDEKREAVKEVIEPLFCDRFSDFFFALDMPIYEWEEMSEAEAYQCGRHIMNYIAHNPEEISIFIVGLQKWATKGTNLCDPITAAQDENMYDEKGEIHIVSYRAVQALMINNKLKCFEKIDLAGVIEKKAMIDIRQIFSKKPGNSFKNEASQSVQVEVQITNSLKQLGASVLLITQGGKILLVLESLKSRPHNWLGGQVVEVMISSPGTAPYFIYYENEDYYFKMIKTQQSSLDFQDHEAYRSNVSQALCMYLIIYLMKTQGKDIRNPHMSFSHNRIHTNVLAYVEILRNWYPIQHNSEELDSATERKVAKVNQGVIDITDVIAVNEPSPA